MRDRHKDLEMLFSATNSLGKETIVEWVSLLSLVWDITMMCLATVLKVLVNRMKPESHLFCAVVDVHR